MPADDELDLYITNDRELYEKGRKLIYAKLADAKLAGNYSRAVALREFKSLADKGAKKYQREVQARYFTSDEKKAYAESAADYFEAEWNIGNMREYATSASQWNPAHSLKQNPWEVHSESGLEGVFADEDDARFYAEEIRGGGARQIRVERRVRQAPRRNPGSRLFSGVYPTGIVYADKARERDGDYLRVAFLPFSTLQLEWAPGSHPAELRAEIERDAAQVIAQRGEQYPVSASGQTVKLGKENPALGDKYVLGTYGPGSRVQLGEWTFPSWQPSGFMQPGDWVTVVYNHADTNGVVGVKPDRTGGVLERDGRHPLVEVDPVRSVRQHAKRNPIEMHENPGARVLREKYGDSSTIVVEHNRYGITGWLESGRGGGRMPISFGATKPDTLRQAMELAKKFLAGVYGKSNPAKNPARRRETEVPINKTSVVGVDPHGFAYVIDERSGVSFMGPRASSIAREVGLQAIHEAPVASYAPDPERKQRLAEWQDLAQARRRTNPRK